MNTTGEKLIARFPGCDDNDLPLPLEIGPGGRRLFCGCAESLDGRARVVWPGCEDHYYRPVGEGDIE